MLRVIEPIEQLAVGRKSLIEGAGSESEVDDVLRSQQLKKGSADGG